MRKLKAGSAKNRNKVEWHKTTTPPDDQARVMLTVSNGVFVTSLYQAFTYDAMNDDYTGWHDDDSAYSFKATRPGRKPGYYNDNDPSEFVLAWANWPSPFNPEPERNHQ